MKNTDGCVFLVGAGPGDPELLTVKALRLLQQADVVLYDRLVSDDIMNLVAADAERVYVGKQARFHTLPQDNINELLTHYAKQGKQVVRLKGGDPFIFGRGGEEIEHLAAAGVSFEVVPGITAASGCSAYAGIPLTHRDHAQSVRFITGHLKDGEVNLNWKALVEPGQTLVFYMGLTGMEAICRELIAAGCAPDTPAACIQQGTTANQQVVSSDLRGLYEAVQGAALKPPTLMIVGGVVSLRDKLHWYTPP